MILSILICTIPSRRDMLQRLTFELRSQMAKLQQEIEILISPENATYRSIGSKRQQLLEAAQGDYVLFIDDDDMVSSHYLEEITSALQEKPDIVGFSGVITTDGKKPLPFTIGMHNPYCDVKDVNGKLLGYNRFNNHLSPVKRSIALQIGYKDMQYGEDYDYACRLKESRLIKTETYIEKTLYFYLYVSKKSHS